MNIVLKVFRKIIGNLGKKVVLCDIHIAPLSEMVSTLKCGDSEQYRVQQWVLFIQYTVVILIVCTQFCNKIVIGLARKISVLGTYVETTK